MVTRAIMRTVAFETFVWLAPCCDVAQAATQFWFAFCADDGESVANAASAATESIRSFDDLATLASFIVENDQADFFTAGTGTPAIFTWTEKSVLRVVK